MDETIENFEPSKKAKIDDDFEPSDLESEEEEDDDDDEFIPEPVKKRTPASKKPKQTPKKIGRPFKYPQASLGQQTKTKTPEPGYIDLEDDIPGLEVRVPTPVMQSKFMIRGGASEASRAPSYSALVRCNWGKIVKMGVSEASN